MVKMGAFKAATRGISASYPGAKKPDKNGIPRPTGIDEGLRAIERAASDALEAGLPLWKTIPNAIPFWLAGCTQAHTLASLTPEGAGRKPPCPKYQRWWEKNRPQKLARFPWEANTPLVKGRQRAELAGPPWTNHRTLGPSRIPPKVSAPRRHLLLVPLRPPQQVPTLEGVPPPLETPGQEPQTLVGCVEGRDTRQSHGTWTQSRSARLPESTGCGSAHGMGLTTPTGP